MRKGIYHSIAYKDREISKDTSTAVTLLLLPVYFNVIKLILLNMDEETVEGDTPYSSSNSPMSADNIGKVRNRINQLNLSTVSSVSNIVNTDTFK